VLHYVAVSYDFRDLDQQLTVVFRKKRSTLKDTYLISSYKKQTIKCMRMVPNSLTTLIDGYCAVLNCHYLDVKRG
jgi:hypothetical protein